MQCAGCHFEAPPDFLFCPRCGAELRPACPACGFRSSPEFTFCPGCGRRVAGTAAPDAAPAPPSPAERATDPGASANLGHREAERRLATVLFADLSGFTALSETLDPEDVRSVQRDLFREMTAVLERFGGTIEKYAGDAVMAVFGAPVAHEDDPERALSAALAMHAAMERLGPEWERRVGHRLELHVGVNTGTVVAGAMGLYGGDAYVVTGDAVNVAARLQGAAGPGETFVGDGTWFLTQHAFEFDGATELTLKGKSRPLPVHRLIGARSAGAARARPAMGAPLVGRERETRALVDAFDRMLAGRAQVACVVGDAGVGKTRLIDGFVGALASDGRLEGVTLRRTVCPPHGDQPFGVIAALARDHYGIDERDTLPVARAKARDGMARLGGSAEDMARLEPVLAPLFGLADEVDAPEIDPQQLERQIFLAVRTLCELQLARAPLVLVVEDLHWADAASVELLAFLAGRNDARKLLLVHTFRPWPGSRAIEDADSQREILRLGPLARDAAGEMLDGLVGDGSIPQALREQVLERAGGHPLYLEELVRGLVAAGTLVRTERGLEAGGGSGVPAALPPSIQALLLARLDRLGPPARRLAQEAAVVGPLFEEALLAAVASDPASVPAALVELSEADLLDELPGERVSENGRPPSRRFRFTHTLVQEVVYESLLRTRRAHLHGAVGRALEGGRAGDEAGERIEALTRLGHHFSLSDEPVKGARYLLAAGDRARAVHAHEDAVRSYRKALAALAGDAGGGPEAQRAGEGLADLLGPSGERDEALELYGALLGAFEAEGDPAAEARILRKTGHLLWEAGDRTRALACFEKGLDRMEGHPEHIERAHLYQEMGRLAFRSGENDRAAEWAARSLAYAMALGAANVDGDAERAREAALAEAHAHNTLGIALARMERPREAVEQIRRSVEVAERHELWPAACRGLANLGVLYCSLDPAQAIETCREGLRLSERIGDLGLQSQLRANLAVAYCSLTDRCDDDGLHEAQAAVELDRQLGRLDHMAVPLIVLGQIHQCSGAFEDALRYYGEALELAEAVQEPQLLFPCYDGIATVHLDLGDHAEAERYLLEAERVCQEAGLQPESLLVLPFFS